MTLLSASEIENTISIFFRKNTIYVNSLSMWSIFFLKFVCPHNRQLKSKNAFLTAWAGHLLTPPLQQSTTIHPIILQ